MVATDSQNPEMSYLGAVVDENQSTEEAVCAENGIRHTKELLSRSSAWRHVCCVGDNNDKKVY